MKNYDSKPETIEHISKVCTYLLQFVKELIDRGTNHDQSKIGDIEKPIFDEFTQKLKSSTYGSPEYFQFLKDMKIALDHHYKENRHHPEHYPNGIKDMNLIDIIEMIADWYAATKRHDNGNIFTSIENNQERFGYSDELKSILTNTAKWLIDSEKERE